MVKVTYITSARIRYKIKKPVTLGTRKYGFSKCYDLTETEPTYLCPVKDKGQKNGAIKIN